MIQGGNKMIVQVKKISLFLLLFLFVGVSLTGLGIESHAEENGGLVETNGVVGFYEDSSSSSDSTSSNPTSNSSTSSQVIKPTGRFPSTGELVKKSLSISGLLLLLIVLFLLFKRKKERDKGGESK